MPASRRKADDVGLECHRNSRAAVHTAAQFWSTVHRRNVLTGAFALGVYTTPVTRWLAVPSDPDASHSGTRRVGRQDLDALWAAAAHAQRQDSRFGGGTREASHVDRILREHAVPLLHGGYSDAVRRELYAGTAELARVAG
ncbi:hypothetical protein [Streptomyces sp. NPDC094468]|uniref:hypothetical protein n=1 Tax=Streptomyces sp. NPDC094468 TaxID=3366066 RepID=UPI00382CA092